MNAVEPLRSLRNVQPLWPIRVLLVGRDTRYLRAVDFLLCTRGYETRRIVRGRNLAREASRFDADVVVVEAGRDFSQAARQAGELTAKMPEIGVVVALERRPPEGAERVRFVSKWESFDALTDAIERVWAELPARRPARRDQRPG
jgi:hypothetical protein